MLHWVKSHIPCVCVNYGNLHDELTEICRQAQPQAPGLLFGLYRRMLGTRLMARPEKDDIS
jgi:hypothetical protein